MWIGAATLAYRTILLALAIFLFSTPTLSQEIRGTASGNQTVELPQASPGALVYKPAMRSARAGGGRVAAAVRGEEGEAPSILALAPDHVGVTSRKQPTLYWYISKPTSGRLVFTLNDARRSQALIEADLASPREGGIQAIKLSDLNADLAPGVVYQWFVKLKADSGQPSKEARYGGSIMYEDPSPDLKKRLADAGAAGAPTLYAGEGLWYDAFAATWNASKADEEKSNRQQRISLLKQIGFGAPSRAKMTIETELEILRLIEQTGQ